MKLKILGMALLACVATSAFAVTNASSTVAGHFEHQGPGGLALITGHEAKGTSHQLKFRGLKDGTHDLKSDPAIVCDNGTYEGTVAAKSVQSITLTPKYTNCHTESSATTNEVVVHVNGCGYIFSSHGANTHGTVEVECPSNVAIEITHPNCNITIPAQTVAGGTLTDGITYDTVTESNIHALTATVTVNTITGHYHGGICIFLGTSHKFRMDGSVTVRGYEHLGGTPPKEGKQIGITHT